MDTSCNSKVGCAQNHSEIRCSIVHETDAAVLVTTEDHPDNGIWLPLSQISYMRRDADAAESEYATTLHVANWILRKTGLA